MIIVVYLILLISLITALFYGAYVYDVIPEQELYSSDELEIKNKKIKDRIHLAIRYREHTIEESRNELPSSNLYGGHL
jgi:hypothetical protein